MAQVPAPQKTGKQPPARVALLVIADCPNGAGAAAVLSDALVSVGQPSEAFTTVVIESAQDAQLHDFIGSPSIHVDGRDILPVPGAQPALACRTYVHTDGSRSGIPEINALTHALSAVFSRRPDTRANPADPS